MEQVVPHTFLRTRLLTHVFGGAADEHKQAAATIKHVCERLQADRNEGKPAADGALVATFHRQLARRLRAGPHDDLNLLPFARSGGRFFASHYVHS